MSWPITEKLHGGSLPAKGDLAAAIEPILAGIQSRIDQNIDMTIRGRIDGVRVNFDPSATDVTSIGYRLRVACHRGGFTIQTKYDDEDPRSTFEWLLRPLVHWNRVVFQDIPHARRKGNKDKEAQDLIPTKEQHSYTHHFNDCLAWLGMKLMRFDVITKEKEDQIVPYLMDELRQQILKVESKGKVLNETASRAVEEVKERRPKLKGKWTIIRAQEGMEKRLRACFERDELSSEDYEDLLEQQFYGLRRYIEDEIWLQPDGDYFELEEDPED